MYYASRKSQKRNQLALKVQINEEGIALGKERLVFQLKLSYHRQFNRTPFPHTPKMNIYTIHKDGEEEASFTEDLFQDAQFPAKRVATPRQKSKRDNQDDIESGSGDTVPTLISSNKHEEESSSQSDESSQSMIQSSQEPRPNKRSKLRKPSKRKSLKKAGNNELEDGGAEASGENEAVIEEDIGREISGNGGPEGADLQPGHESDGSSADTEPYNEGEGGNHGVQAQAIDQHGSVHEYGSFKDVLNVMSGPVNNLMEREESVEEVEEVVVRESNNQENGDEGLDSDHGGHIDKAKMLRFYKLLQDTFEDQQGVFVAHAFARLGLASKQRSANPLKLAASLPRLESGQAFQMTSKKASEEMTTAVDALHQVASELKGFGLHHSSTLQPPAWIPLVKQRRWPIKSSTPVLIAPTSTRLPRRAKTEALAKQVATSLHEKDMRRTPTTSSYDFVDHDDDDFEGGPPPFKGPKFTFKKRDKEEKDKEEADMEKAKKDSLFDNLRDSHGMSASGSGSNNVLDVVGNILHEGQDLHLPGLPGVRVTIPQGLTVTPSTSTSTSRKKSEEDEVQILNESISRNRETEAGTSSSSSSNFKGSCPLCNLVFENPILLETHASTCDGQSPDQVT